MTVEEDWSLPNSENRRGYFDKAEYYACIDAKCMEATERISCSIMASGFQDNYELIDFVDKGEYKISTYRNCSY